MPLVQISLLRGKPAPYIRAIADGVHQALVATFDTPLHDRFQIIHQLAPEDLIFDADYLDVHRTSDLVVIHIVASKTRSTAQKQAFYQAVAANLARDPGLRPQDVQIILSPNEREDWSFGNGVASYVPATPPPA
jgi:phenylpyruvate tautomerase PptA (4-oxalocrotonate tautomerase family)